MVNALTSNPRGTITPGALLLIGGLLVAGWFVLQPESNRASLACQPLAPLTRWLGADPQSDSQWDRKVAQFMAFINAKCPESVGTPAASLAKTAHLFANTTLTTVKSVANRNIPAVFDSRTLKISGIGIARLLGITVPPEHQAAALQYLQDTCASKRLPIQLYSDHDAEYYPLVVVYLDTDQTSSVNAQLVQKGLATPWNLPGPWDAWAPLRAASSAP